MQTKFYQDLEILNKLLDQDWQETFKFFTIIKQDNKQRILIDKFLQANKIQINEESRLAAVERLVLLSDNSLRQVLKNQHFSDLQIRKVIRQAYKWVWKYYQRKQNKLIDIIENKGLFTPFYREIISGIHEIGIQFSNWQTSWTNHIINKINKNLEKKYQNNDKKIIEILYKKNLLDLDHHNQLAQKSYTALIKKNNKYISQAYIQIFPTHINNITTALQKLIQNLKLLQDDVFNLQNEYMEYFQCLIDALNEHNIPQLSLKWGNVDRAWMKINTPLQIGHPLEYYEDKYRKAVALEWDLRIINPHLQDQSHIKQDIINMYHQIYQHLKNNNYKNMYQIGYKQIENVKLYLGSTCLMYGAVLNGLFSAQVVPNDEEVSVKYGKKIFGSADHVLRIQRAKPFMKITSKIYELKFIKEDRKFLFQETNNWYKIFDITVIGHEYGHILWQDLDTEVIMNQTGNFKNIEEFKASLGGILSYFLSSDNALYPQVINSVIKRSIGLIGYMEADETVNYYCEGLIFLEGLFQSGIIKFDNKIQVDTSLTKFNNFTQWCLAIYTDLVKNFYLPKKDASDFLDKYLIKEKNVFLPQKTEIKKFVQYYYDLYQKIGRDIDESDSAENYLI